MRVRSPRHADADRPKDVIAEVQPWLRVLGLLYDARRSANLKLSPPERRRFGIEKRLGAAEGKGRP